MPKSGQTWSSTFLARSELLSDFSELATPLLSAGGWPTLADYTLAAEIQREQRAPDLVALSFAPARPKRGRGRRGEAVELENSYDGSIALRREIPCLVASYHDWFNALVWMAFPRTKRALHARQFRALKESVSDGMATLPNRRSREQDALTIFDEGGCVVVRAAEAADCVVRAKGGRDGAPPGERWVGSRDAGESLGERADTRLVIFGHALMEHVSLSSAPVHAVAMLIEHPGAVLPAGLALFEFLDQALAARVTDPQEFAAPRRDPVVWIEPPNGAWLDALPTAP